MRAILMQGLYLIIALAGIYGALLGFSYALVPPVKGGAGLDSGHAASTLFTTEPKYVLLNRAALQPTLPRVVVVGASNSVVGLKQRELQSLMPHAEVDNLSVGGSNMTQIAQIVDLVQDLQDAEARRRTTYVIGMWYGMFTQNSFRWETPDRHKGDTDINIEQYRYGFYRRTENGPKQILPTDKLQFGVILIHPYLVFDQASRWASEAMRYRFAGRPPHRTDAERNATIVSAPDRESALKYWHEQMHSDGSIADEQFVVLKDLILRTVAQGSKVVLVDLPIPRWHAESSPFYPEYLRQKNLLLDALQGKAGVAYLDMTDENSDLDFSDEVHPKPRVTQQWASRVAAMIATEKP
jgi:hypothetical protein